MKVQKIELIGFKSFADRTVFHLHPGITCIVGPNGCGKSNIVDAFRWVLGEQSAKTLRGDRMQEVIFNGSETKKPKGMAEVTLYLLMPEPEDNGDSAQKVVTVTRRLYRSGDSEYLINRQPCRLKDIREIFLDTGLEMKSYSILEQGRIGEIINARAEDRRFLIEEIAGIMKYKARKAEAETKLQNSRYNLQRINDILTEVKRQRNSLQRQAKKAERYKKLLDRLRHLEIRIARQQYNELTERLKLVQTHIADLKTKEAQKRREITALESRLQQKKTALVEKEQFLLSCQRSLHEIETGLKEAEKEHDLLLQEISHLQTSVKELSATLTGTDNTIRNKKLTLKELHQQYNEHVQKRQGLEQDLSVQVCREEQLKKEINNLEESLDSKRRLLFNLTDSIGSHRNSINTLTVRIEELKKRQTQADRELREAQRRSEELKDEIKKTEALLSEAGDKLQKLAQSRQALTDELIQTRKRIQELENKKLELIAQKNSIQSKIQTLTAMITTPVNREEFLQNGITLRAFSEIINVPQEYEVAVEAALSDKLKGIIVGSVDELKRAVQIVKKGNIQKTTFLTTIEVHQEQTTGQVNGRPLVDVVSVEPAYAGLVKTLLEDYCLVEDIQTGLQLTDRHRHLRAVTIDGEVIEKGIVITCGNSPGVLPLSRQVRELKDTLQEIQNELAETESTLQEQNNTIQRLKDLLKDTEAAMAKTEKELSLHQATLNRHKEDLQRFQKKTELLEFETEQIEEEIQHCQDEIDEISDRLSQDEAYKEEVNSGLLKLQDEIQKKKKELQSYSHIVTDAKVQLQVLTEKMRHIKNEKDRVKEELQRLEHKKESIKKEITNRQNLIQKKKERLRELKTTIQETIEKAEAKKRLISETTEALQQKRQKVQELEEEVKTLTGELEGFLEQLHQQELIAAELTPTIDAIVKQIYDKYGTDITGSDIIIEDSDDLDVEEIERLRREIQQMEPVNLAALEEFNQVQQRYEFLSTQQSDIINSIQELEAAIRRIDTTTRERLSEAFQKLNQKFSEVFIELFGGGRAELRLTEDNLLTAGLEIIAQPPGKRLQNINLLSGGEKALTALALMFAGFLLKPTPVCILDEADSPLDENNTEKFKMMLKRLSENIQFIVITHNRRTMEIADYLYGITMEEPGVSRVLSLQLS